MKITCESCGAKYTIADDKVRGRKVKIRCKGCATPMVVDGQQPNSATEDAFVPDGQVPDGQEDASAMEASPTASPEPEWSVNLSETEQISVSAQQLVEEWKAGRVSADAFVWRDGMGDWVPILECTELAPLLSPPPPPAAATEVSAEPAPMNSPSPAAAASASRPSARAIRPAGAAARATANAARVAGGRAQKASDLFAGVEKAGSDEEEVATSAPALPLATASKPEEKPTGARNENSVLFSLDAMKAGFAAPPPRPTSRTTSPTVDPLGMEGDPLAGLGGGNPLFTLSDNQALLTAPPPPDPPKRIAQSVADDSAPRPRTNRILVAVGSVSLIAVGLLLGLLFFRENDTPAVAGTGEKPADSASEKAGGEALAKAEEPAKQETAKDTPADGPASAPSAAAPESADGKQAESKESSTRATQASKLAASKDKASAKEEPKSTSSLAPFNRAAAVAALSAAASQAGKCKRMGGPTGTGKVQVTFAPSGRVTSATVAGAPFAGTSVGGCVAAAFRRSTVPAFSGSSLAVSKSFTIR